MITVVSLLSLGYFPEVKLLAAKGVQVDSIVVLPSAKGEVEVSQRGLRVVKHERSVFILVDSPVKSIVLKVPRGIGLEMATLRSEVLVSGVSLNSLAINDVAGHLRIEGCSVGDLTFNLVDSDVSIKDLKAERAEFMVMDSDITLKDSRIGALSITAAGGKMRIINSRISKLRKKLKDFKIVWR